jgi:hypothetical protein
MADVIICTPERLDALLRLANSTAEGHQQAHELFTTCSVLVFDELHLVGRSGRGPRFELILARVRQRQPDLKILGLAAAAHGSQELSEWLGDAERIEGARRPTGTLELVWEKDGSIRQRLSQGSPSKVADIPRGRQALDDAADLLLRLRDRYTPALAICTNRTSAENLAKRVSSRDSAKGEAWRSSLSEADSESLAEAIEEVRALLGDDHPLGNLMERGIAFHHAGVPTHALEQIETLAKKGLLRLVSATTTVAEGADLPFRVVVIPHLTFPGESKQLERDLYLNIIGRAGRANVAVEGMVFILDSDAKMFQNHVRGSLWATSARDFLRGRLATVGRNIQDVDRWNDFTDIENQVMAWLADPASYVENQASVFAEQTFTYSQGNRSEKQAVVELFGVVLNRLERDQYALAASPYRLTERGAVAQLTGLSTPGVRRLTAAVERGREGWLGQLTGLTSLNGDFAALIASLVFETPEVFQHSLWLRRNAKDKAKLGAMSRFAYHNDLAHQGSRDFELDLSLLSEWIRGASYQELADAADVAPRSNSMFGGNDGPKRVSDATEYVGKLVYPASWVWSGAQIIASEAGLQFPAFVRGAIEYGVPTESAVQLIERGGLTRAAAMQVAALAGPTWEAASAWVTGDDVVETLRDQFTRADQARLVGLRERILAEDS